MYCDDLLNDQVSITLSVNDWAAVEALLRVALDAKMLPTEERNSLTTIKENINTEVHLHCIKRDEEESNAVKH